MLPLNHEGNNPPLSTDPLLGGSHCRAAWFPRGLQYPLGDCYQQKDALRVALSYPFFRDPLPGVGQNDRNRPPPRAPVFCHH